jgi:hypothetical protein
MTRILPERGIITHKAAVSTIPEASVWSLHDNKEVAPLLFGSSNRSGQRSTLVEYIEQSRRNMMCLPLGNRTSPRDIMYEKRKAIKYQVLDPQIYRVPEQCTLMGPSVLKAPEMAWC